MLSEANGCPVVTDAPGATDTVATVPEIGKGDARPGRPVRWCRCAPGSRRRVLRATTAVAVRGARRTLKGVGRTPPTSTAMAAAPAEDNPATTSAPGSRWPPARRSDDHRRHTPPTRLAQPDQTAARPGRAPGTTGSKSRRRPPRLPRLGMPPGTSNTLVASDSAPAPATPAPARNADPERRPGAIEHARSQRLSPSAAARPALPRSGNRPGTPGMPPGTPKRRTHPEPATHRPRPERRRRLRRLQRRPRPTMPYGNFLIRYEVHH